MNAQPHPNSIKRILPAKGSKLDCRVIRSKSWWPTSAVECAGVFAVSWDDANGCRYWAALHDFEANSIQALLSQCSNLDKGMGARGW